MKCIFKKCITTQIQNIRKENLVQHSVYCADSGDTQRKEMHEQSKIDIAETRQIHFYT